MSIRKVLENDLRLAVYLRSSEYSHLSQKYLDADPPTVGWISAC
jgi:hypothetical protein